MVNSSFSRMTYITVMLKRRNWTRLEIPSPLKSKKSNEFNSISISELSQKSHLGLIPRNWSIYFPNNTLTLLYSYPGLLWTIIVATGFTTTAQSKLTFYCLNPLSIC